MPVSKEILLAQCAQTIDATDFPALGIRTQGKVRDSYVKDGRRTIVATDRISAFDVVLGTIPLIIRDERQGKATTVGIAVALIFAGELMLTFFGVGFLPVFAALAVFFAGFNFLEAGLPARLSLLADADARGVSLGVFSSAQFLGAFVGGLIGGRFLAASRPADVFFVCALLAAIWLATSSLFHRDRTPSN